MHPSNSEITPEEKGNLISSSGRKGYIMFVPFISSVGRFDTAGSPSQFRRESQLLRARFSVTEVFYVCANWPIWFVTWEEFSSL